MRTTVIAFCLMIALALSGCSSSESGFGGDGAARQYTGFCLQKEEGTAQLLVNNRDEKKMQCTSPAAGAGAVQAGDAFSCNCIQHCGTVCCQWECK